MYGKFFSSTFTGSMYGAGPCAFAVWGYVVANTKEGFIELNPKFLAPIIGAEEDEIQRAIAYHCAPDPSSRNPEHGGRRLLPVGAFLYSVPSHRHYRSIRDENERREYMRDYMRRKRKDVNTANCEQPASKSTVSGDVNTSVSPVSPYRSRSRSKSKNKSKNTTPSEEVSDVAQELSQELGVTGKRNLEAVTDALRLWTKQLNKPETEVANDLLSAWLYYRDRRGSAPFKFESATAYLQNGNWQRDLEMAKWLGPKKPVKTSQ